MNLTLDLQIASRSSEGLPSEADFRKWAEAAVEDFRDDAEVTIRIVDEAESTRRRAMSSISTTATWTARPTFSPSPSSARLK